MKRRRTRKATLVAVVFGALMLAAAALAATKPIHGKIIGTSEANRAASAAER